MPKKKLISAASAPTANAARTETINPTFPPEARCCTCSPFPPAHRAADQRVESRHVDPVLEPLRSGSPGVRGDRQMKTARRHNQHLIHHCLPSRTDQTHPAIHHFIP